MGLRKPLRQRPEFAVASKQCLKMQDALLAETRQSPRLVCPDHQQRRRDQHFGGEKFDCFVNRKTGWRYYREPRGNPSAASSYSTSRWQNSVANELELMVFHIIWEMGDFGFLEAIPENRRVCRQDTHSQISYVQYSLITSAEGTHNALGSIIAYHLYASKKV